MFHPEGRFSPVQNRCRYARYLVLLFAGVESAVAADTLNHMWNTRIMIVAGAKLYANPIR